jgi:HNH endonuclease
MRQYLLEKFARQCAYCGQTNLPMEVEHIIPRSRGGSNRISNLPVACHACTQAKGDRTAEEFGHLEVQAQAKAALNATRGARHRRLVATGLPVATGSGGRTKWHRTQRQRGHPKTPWLAAAGVGASTPQWVRVEGVVPLLITAMGRHSRQMCRPIAFGFPDKAPQATSVVSGLRTGDIVRAVVPAGNSTAGVYLGRSAIRATRSCNVKTAAGTIQGIHVRYCQPLHRADDYGYQQGVALPPQA